MRLLISRDYRAMLMLLVSGCSSLVPTAIRDTPAPDIQLEKVRHNIDEFSGTKVRWGGVISKVENKASRTWIEIVSRNLRKNGAPLPDSQSHGRFIASFAGFIEPLDYKIGAHVTIVGNIVETHIGLIGEYRYHFPVVRVNTAYLWPEKVDVARDNDYPPSWYAPWPYHRRPYFPY